MLRSADRLEFGPGSWLAFHFLTIFVVRSRTAVRFAFRVFVFGLSAVCCQLIHLILRRFWNSRKEYGQKKLCFF